MFFGSPPSRPTKTSSSPAISTALRLGSLILVLLLSACQSAPVPAQTPSAAPPIQADYNVLILNSYHVGYQWSEDIVAGIRSTFNESTIHPEIFVEYMDTKRYKPEEIFPILRAMYGSKYQHIHFDAIISVDNTALYFLSTYHDQLFPGVPVIFVGVNGLQQEMLGGLTEITGIAESLDEADTVDLILQLLPETRHLALITDSTVTGEIHARRFHDLAPKYAERLEFLYFSNLTKDELARALQELPDDTVIFFRSFFRDRANESLTVEEALQLINTHSPAPIFTTWDFTLGQGVVGGALLTGESQGQAAAALALQVLQGTPASTLPILQSSPSQIFLDYNQLQALNIPAPRVPVGSTIINRPPTFYRQYRTTILGGSAFLIGQTVVILLMFAAIRRQHKAEEKLTAAENKLARMLQNVVNGVIVLNPDQTLAYINPSAREILNVPETTRVGDVFSLPVWTPVDENGQPLLPDTLPLPAALQKNVETNNVLYRFITSEGQVKWLTISAAPITDDEGNTISAIASFSDSTSRQLAVQVLQKSEKRFRTLIEQIVDAIFICELDGRIVEVNQRAYELLGYSRAEMLSLNAYDLFAVEDKEKMAAAWLQLIKGNIQTNEGYHRTRTGQIIPVEMNTGLIELEGRDRILLISRDITERYQAQQVLLEERASLEQHVLERTAELQRVNAELNKAARAKDEFLANMSHELRTPLNAILGMSEMLGDELYGPLNERQLKYMQIIQESGRHLLDLINDILDLSKIEAGQLKLDFQPILIEDVCRSTVSFVQQAAENKNIQINFQNLSTCTQFHADARAMKQILVNLLSNAVKFSLQNGQIDFTVEDIPAKQAVRFTVRDYGIGIPPEKMDRLFKPFSQIDGSLSRSYEGTGLGLALVARLTEMHGGGTWLHSSGQYGEGSTFSVTLPCQVPALHPPVLPSWTKQYHPAHPLVERILLAGDSETCIQYLSTTLQALGCQVTVARSGLEMISAARHRLPDLILLHMHLPDMDGWQALAMLHEDLLLRAVPVIALTSQFIDHDDQRYQQSGATVYIQKPFPIDLLLECIQTHRLPS